MNGSLLLCIGYKTWMVYSFLQDVGYKHWMVGLLLLDVDYLTHNKEPAVPFGKLLI